MPSPEPSLSPSAEDELQSTDPRNCPSPLSGCIKTEPVQRPLPTIFGPSSAIGKDDPPTSPTGQDLTSASSATQTSSRKALTPQDELPSKSSATQKSSQISPPTSDIEDEDIVVSASTQHKPSVQYLHGLYNQGATCYLNSVLQVLFRTEDFRAAVERHNHGNCLDCRLQSFFDELKRTTGRTHSITSCLGINRVYEQQDAAEYLEKILSSSNPDVSQVFHGLLTHSIICSSCGTETDSDGPFWNLPLALVDSDTELYSVVKGIEDFFREKHFRGKNRVYCDSCHSKSDATTKRVIKNHPDVLMLLLKRFTFDYKYMQYVKINSDVIIPDTLQIPENQTYELYAVVDHFGSLRGGHYTATINVNGEWYTFNDSSVTKTQPVSITSSSAYLIFYKKTKEMPAPEPSPSSRHSSWPKKVWTDLFKGRRWPFSTIFGSSSAIVEDDPPTSPTGQDLTSASSDTQTDSSGKASTPQDELPSLSSATQKSPQISPPTSDIEDEDHVVSSSTQHKPSAPSSKESKTYQMVVNGMRGEEMIIDLCNTEEQMQKVTVLQLKEKIIQRLPGLDDVACLVLIFADEMLDGDSTLLCSYGIQHMSVIHVVIRLAQISSPTSDTEDEDPDASSSTQPEPSEMPAPEPSLSPSAEDELQSTDPRNCPSPLSDSIKTEPVQREPMSQPGRALHGLYNQGGTSYLNCVLQVLFMTKEIHDRLTETQTDRALKELFNDLQNKTCGTETITRCLSFYDVFKQRDAANCLEQILHHIGEEASDVFQGQLSCITRCCKKHTVHEESKKFWIFPLSLKHGPDRTYCVEKSFQDFFQPETFTGNNKLLCDTCGNKTAAETRREMSKYPDILTVLLKAFDFDVRSDVKSKCSVNVPHSLELENKTYELYGIVDHTDSRAGHYTATILSSEDNTWHQFNDEHVSKLQVHEQPCVHDGYYNSQNAYLLMYRALTINMGSIYQVVVTGLRGEEMIIGLCNTEEQMQKMTVLQLKEKIVERVSGHDDVEDFRLIFTDKMLDEDSALLSSYGIQHKSVIHLKIRLHDEGWLPPPPRPRRRRSIERSSSF